MAHKTDFCPLKGLAEVAKRTFRSVTERIFIVKLQELKVKASKDL